MLFLGHFSFDEREDAGRFGHFTCVVEAKTPNAAEKALAKLIRRMKKKGDIFSTAAGAPVEIYLDTLNEMAEVPTSGVISWYSSYTPDGLAAISTALLPHGAVGGCKGYFFLPSDRPDIAEKVESGERHEVVPFITFEPTPVERRTAELKEEIARQEAQSAALAQQRKPFTRKRPYE